MTSEVGENRIQCPSESALVAAAVSGDRLALERLLLNHFDRLARQVGAKLPARLQSTQAVEDILQVTFLQAFRDIGHFQQRTGATFGDWLSRIAENRLRDAIRQFDRQKRGGGTQRIERALHHDSDIQSLWDWLAAADTSPPSVVARGEALHALQVALAALPDDQRSAIKLRLLEGKSLQETAHALGRTSAAIRGLVHRGKQQLLAAMGRASQWLRSK